jgi:serine/threonine protein kinase
MPAPTTGNVFLELLRKSNLLPESRLAEYLGRLTDPDRMAPTELAARMVQDGLLTPFQARNLIRGRYKNFFLGKFKILGPLGSGGMSRVYLCEHAVMRHRVAAKMLPVREGADPIAVTRFLREARAAAAINHPNVVRAHDFDLADGKYYYLIMDYVDGVNLHDLVKRIGPLNVAHAANYVAQTAAGLQHIADCGLVHRDIKPSNLLLDRTGVVKILDLGLARSTTDDTDNVTRQYSGQTVLGTADYLSPEQALLADRIDIRADIYSLGATFYFLLAGRAPFEESSVPQKLLAHQLRDPPPIPNIPDALQTVIRRMIRKKADERFQCPAEVIDALVPWLTDELPLPDETWFPDRPEPAGPGSGPRTPSTPSPVRTPVPPLSGLRTRPQVTIEGSTSGENRSPSTNSPELLNQPRPRSRKWLIAAIVAGVLIVAATIYALVRP